MKLTKELQQLLIKWRETQINFEKDIEENNDTKGSLDALEYAQSDVYEWVKNNIKVNETK